MPRVLIHGATGMIGNTIALALVVSGNHTVYGIARTEEKAQGLAALEIHPVVCADPINNPKPWLDVLKSARIDTVIDAAGYLGDCLKVFEHIREFGKQRIATAQKEDVVLPQKLGYIYISGAWVHGDSRTPVSDLDPVGVASSPTPPADLVADRPKWEQVMLKSRDVLDVGIVRPALVYGNNSWVLNSVLDPIHQAAGSSSVQIPTTTDSWPQFIHVEDVALVSQAVLERLPVLNSGGVYPVFSIGTSQENMSEVVKAFAKSLGYGGKLEFVGPGDNIFFKALSTSFNLDISRAKTLLEWEPKKVGVMGKADTYAMAWKANKALKR